MSGLKDKALEISNKFPFSAFNSQASANNSHSQADDKLTFCENHLDMEFMKLLEEGAHLDLKKMPL